MKTTRQEAAGNGREGVMNGRGEVGAMMVCIRVTQGMLRASTSRFFTCLDHKTAGPPRNVHSPTMNTMLCRAASGCPCMSAHRNVPSPMPTRLPLKPCLHTSITKSVVHRRAITHRPCAKSSSFLAPTASTAGSRYSENADCTAAPMTPVGDVRTAANAARALLIITMACNT